MISRATVPWPAMVAGWSKVGTTVAPVSAAVCGRAAARASSKLSPAKCRSTRSPASARMRATFWRGVRTGRNTAPRTPRWRQLHATPWAWLPALAHTTPAASDVGREAGDEVVGAADLVGPDRLEVLALEVDRGAVALRQPLVELERGQDAEGRQA